MPRIRYKCIQLELGSLPEAHPNQPKVVKPAPVALRFAFFRHRRPQFCLGSDSEPSIEGKELSPVFHAGQGDGTNRWFMALYKRWMTNSG